ncbi:MAG: hypothetical protein JNJ54_33750 [Myxococcaceae bacterium]|nr:hypothetical protein [Myxococcaceae bacterium]
MAGGSAGGTAGGATAGGSAGGTAGGTAGGAAGGTAGGATAGGSAAGTAGGATAGGSAAGTAGGATAGGSAGGSAGGATAGGAAGGATAGGSAAGTAGGATAGGSAGGIAGGTAAGGSAGGTAGGTTAGGSAGGATAGGSAGGTAGGATAGGSAGGSAGGATAGGAAGGAAGGSAGGATAGGSSGGAPGGGSAAGGSAGGAAGGAGGGSAGGATAGGSSGGAPGGGSAGGPAAGGFAGGATSGGAPGGGSAGGTAAGGSAGGAAAGGSAGGATAGGSAGGATGGGEVGDVCVTAPILSLPAQVPGQTLAGVADDYQWSGQPGCASDGTWGPDRAYQVVVPPGMRLRATASPQGAWDPSLQLTEQCLPGLATTQTCLAGANRSGPAQDETLTSPNDGPAPRAAWLVVDTASPPGALQTFDLDLDAIPIVPGDLCAAAELLDAGGSLQSMAGFYDDFGTGPGCALAAGPDRAFTVVVPAGHRLSATVSAFLADGGTAFEPALAVVTSSPCSASSPCAVAAAGLPGNGSASILYDNTSTTPEPATLVVDSFSPTSASFALTLSLAPTVLAAGDTCSAVVSTVATSSTLPGESFEGFVDHYRPAQQGTTCAFEDGADRVYRVSVPPLSRLDVHTTAPFRHSVSLIEAPASACAATPAVCLASRSAFLGGASVLTWENTSSLARDVFLIVDRQRQVTPGPTELDLGIDLVPLPLHETCSTAGPPITAAITRPGETLAGAVNDYDWHPSLNARCVQATSSPDLVYAITVPPLSTVSATVTASTFDAVLNLVSAPGCTNDTRQACLAGADTQSGTLETLSWTNPATTARDVFLVVERRTGSPGPFELGVAFSAGPTPPYRVTPVPSACLQLSGSAQSLTDALGDDVATAWAPLPFAFSFFGAPVTTCSVTSNGLLGLGSLSSGALAAAPVNEPIPSAAVPDGFVAAFWDDLQAAPGAVVRTESVGTPGARRFVVEWAGFTLYPSAGERLTFQVQLIEATGVIEVHLCQLAANGGNAFRTAGGSATLGLEAPSGVSGVEASFQSPRLATGEAVRFTP